MARTTKQTPDSMPSKGKGSIATRPAKQISNNNRFAGEKFTENCELTAHTKTPNGVQPIVYDGVKESSGTIQSHPSWNESVIDRSDRVPAWNSTTPNLMDKDAQGDQLPLNHGKDKGMVDGFRKQPNQINHDMNANKAISQGGVLGQDDFMPSYKKSGFGYYKDQFRGDGGATKPAGNRPDHLRPFNPVFKAE